MVDPASLPLPQALSGDAGSGANAAKDNHPVEFLSVIFNQREQRDVLRISKMAITPMWLKKNMYQKLNTDVQFELPNLEKGELQAKYTSFEQSLDMKQGVTPDEINSLKQKALALYTNAFQEGCDPKELLKH